MIGKAWTFAGWFLILFGAVLLIIKPQGSIPWIMGLVNVVCLGPGSLYFGRIIKQREGKS